MIVTTDIDIDLKDRNEVLKGLRCVTGRINRADNKYEKHNTGVYFQDIPFDPYTNIATIDHKAADKLGYFKIDLLNVHLYESVKNDAHLQQLVDKEPLWALLEHKEVVSKLFHISKYFHLCEQYKPKSLEELAMIIAMIRPGKAHLQGKSWDIVKGDVWVKHATDTFAFKKSHGVAYAMAICVQLNLLSESN